MLEKILKFFICSLIFLLPIFWLPFSFEFLEFNKLYLLFFLSWTGVFIWLLKEILKDKEIRFYWNRLDTLIFFFVLCVIFSFLFSADKRSGFFGSYGRFNNGFLATLSLFGFYILVRNNLKLRPQEKNGITLGDILNSLFLSSFLVLLWVYFSLFGVWLKIPRFSQVAIFNPISSFTEGLAIFLSQIAVLVLTQLLVKEKLKKVEKIFYLIFLIFAFPLLLIFDVGPAWILLSFSLIFFVVFYSREKIFVGNYQKLLLPIFLIILAFLFSFLNFQNVFAFLFKKPLPIFNLPREMLLAQKESWGISFRTVTDNIKNFFFGSGPGTFLADFAKFKSQRMNQGILWQLRWDKAGNHLAEIFATFGVLGGFLFLLILAWLFVVVILQKGEPERISWRSFLLGLGILPFLFYQNMTLAFLFWLGLGIGANFGPRKEKVFPLGEFPLIALIFETITILLGFALLLSYFFGRNFYLADYFYQKGFLERDFDQKISFFQKATEFNPYQPYYQMALSQALISKALEKLQDPSFDPNTLQALFASSTFWAKMAKENGRGNILYQQNLANIYRELIGIATNAEEWAEKYYQEAINLEPKNPLFYIEIGKIKARLKKFDEARQNFDKALALAPHLPFAKIQIALLLEQEGRQAEAISEFEKLVLEFPENSEIYFHLGRLYYNKDELEKAVEKFQQAIFLFPDYSNARFMLALALEKKGEISRAIEEMEIVLKLNPENQVVKSKIEELKRKLNQFQSPATP